MTHKNKPLIIPISILITVIFLWNQAAWAIGPISVPVPTIPQETLKKQPPEVPLKIHTSFNQNDDKGRMQDYRGRTHEYGSYVDAKGKTQTLDVIREFHRHDITYNDKNQMTSYREDRWSSDKPGLIQQAYVYDIQYNAAGLMESYIEQLREVGYVSLEGVPKGLAPPSFGLEDTMRVIGEMANGTSDLLNQYYLVDKTTTTHRTGITYNGLNQVTGYTDTITNPDGTITTTSMTGITYWSDGRIKGYTQTTTGPNDEGEIETHTTNIYNTEYDRLGRVDEKYGTWDGKQYSWKAKEYDELGRPTAYKEKYGKVSYRHYDILYNELGDVAYEKIKVTAKSGTGIFSSKTKVLTEYWYGYDEYGQHEKIKENEIYRKVSTNPIGQIIKAIVGIATAFFTAGMSLWVTAAIMAVENFVFSVLSGADLGQALLSAVISYIATVAGAYIGGALAGDVAGAFAASGPPGVFDLMMRAFNLMNDLAGTDGKTLLESIFGENADLIFGIITAVGGFLAGGIGNNGPPLSLALTRLIAKLAITAIMYALKDASPYLRQFLGTFLNQIVDTYYQASLDKVKIKQAIDQGSNNTKDKQITDISPITRKDPITGKDTGVGYLVTFDDGSQAQLDRNKVPLWYVDSEGNTSFYGLDGNLLGSLPKGWTALTDSTGNYALKYLVPRADGNFDVYDLAIQKEGVLPKGTTAWIGSTGLFNGSVEQTSDGRYILRDWTGSKVYELDNLNNLDLYNFQTGQLEARILDGYTPIETPDGTITGSYKYLNDTTVIVRDEMGKFKYWDRMDIKDGQIVGVYHHDGVEVTYFDTDRIRAWSMANQPHATVYYYDELGQNIVKEVYTKLDASGAVQSKIEYNRITGDYIFYDPQGNQLLPAINPAKIVDNVKDISGYIKQEIINAIRQGQQDISNELFLLEQGFNFFTADQLNPAKVGGLVAGLRALPLTGGIAGTIQQMLFDVIDGGQDIAFQRFVNLAKSGETPYVIERLDGATEDRLNNFDAKLQASELGNSFNISSDSINIGLLYKNLRTALQMDENGVIHANLQENLAAAEAYRQYELLNKIIPENTPNLEKLILIGYNFDPKTTWVQFAKDSALSFGKTVAVGGAALAGLGLISAIPFVGPAVAAGLGTGLMAKGAIGTFGERIDTILLAEGRIGFGGYAKAAIQTPFEFVGITPAIRGLVNKDGTEFGTGLGSVALLFAGNKIQNTAKNLSKPFIESWSNKVIELVKPKLPSETPVEVATKSVELPEPELVGVTAEKPSVLQQAINNIANKQVVNHIDNFSTEKLGKMLPKDREYLRGNPDDIVRVRHNTTPETVSKIKNEWKINPSRDGNIYVEAPDYPIENGVIRDSPRGKELELGILKGKGDAGVEFYVRRGDLQIAPNPWTHNYDLVIPTKEYYLPNSFPEYYSRKE